MKRAALRSFAAGTDQTFAQEPEPEPGPEPGPAPAPGVAEEVKTGVAGRWVGTIGFDGPIDNCIT